MAMSRTTIDGKTINQRTADMLRMAEDRLGINLRIVQGSYNAGGVAASAGTHDGGGVVDIGTKEWSSTEVKQIIQTLREVGFAAWYRTPAQGFDYHIHAVAVGDAELSYGARSQVSDYYAGKNGLASHARDDGPRLNPIPVWPVKLGKIWFGTVLWQYKSKTPKKKVAIRRFQKALAGRGYYKHRIDGICGEHTRAAWRAFLKRRGYSGGLTRKNLVALHKGYDRVL